jgi:hypothetical protein
MLRELSFPAGAWRPEHKEVEERLADALEPQVALLMKSGGKGDGEFHVVVPHLAARSVGDLLVATHLALHGYLTQGYNALRTSHETLELLDLIIEVPEEARKWANSEKPQHEFSPGQVRKRLGRDKFDEAYGQMSEFAHPRFGAFRLGVVGERHVETGDIRLQVKIGPFPVDEMPDHWLLLSLMLPTIGRLMVGTRGLIGSGAVTEKNWDDAVKSTAQALSTLNSLILMKLQEHGLDTSDIDDLFADAGKIIDEADADFPDDENQAATTQEI